MRNLEDARALADRLGESYQLVYLKDESGWSVGAAEDSNAAEMIVVSRTPQSSHFAYAVGGETVVAFDPGYPAPETMWGSDPGRLSHLMNALGLRPPDDDADESWQDSDARALLLAERVTGLLEGPA
ncbi:DUF6461 domain-containing protein [Actinoplanes sp. NBRC 103695]|uniref:DUF6461 domain-containing protein n=1 Tax=Actinoplanes sp. NBRC 103695 TaxID=3032202 RepID=UPI0024A2DC97|nr:DUF6461 domain-containing protein [Actinoplanes sp. NBRC 103695]GLY98541.1 hypothetical protein Acsp02_57950 [Actinoplanes sp. NBRC 103695]